MQNTPISTLLTFPFKDPEWFKKLVILALVLLVSTAIPILPLILGAGYMARIIRKMVVENKDPSLPAWDDLGGIFKDGWRPIAVTFTFLLPIFALFFLGWLTLFLSNFYAPVEQMWANDRNIDPREFMVIVSSLLGGGGFIVAGIFSLFISYLIPAVLVHTVVHQEYAAAFRFKEWWNVLSANLPGFLVAYLIAFGINLVAGIFLQILFFTIILCWAVPLLAFAFTSYSYVVYAALFAEAYRVGEEKRLNRQGQREGEGGKGSEEEQTSKEGIGGKVGMLPEKRTEPGAEKPTQPDQSALLFESDSVPESKAKRKPRRKVDKNAAEAATLVQHADPKSKVDTLPLPPPPHVPGVDTIILPPPASVPGIDTLPLSPAEQDANQPQAGENPE